MLLKLAWRNLWRNKRRTFITAASIFFAVLLAIVMNSLNEGVYDKMIQNVVGFYTGYVQVHKDGYWDDQTLENSFEQVPAVFSSVEEHPTVSSVNPRLETFSLAASDSVTQGCMVVGIQPSEENKLTSLKNKVAEGTYLAEDDLGIMLAQGLAKKLKVSIGDTLVLLGQGYRGAMASGKYPVRALLKFGSPDLNKRMSYITLQEAQYFLAADERLTSLSLSLNSAQAAKKVAADLENSLSEEYEVMEWQEMMPELVQTIEADRGGNVLTMAILYVIIGFGIFGTVLMMTAERKYEFGVMTAIGMSKLKLAAVVVLEMIFMAILGILAGMLASLPIVIYFNRNPIDLGPEMAEAYASYGFEAVLPMVIRGDIFLNQAFTVLFMVLLISAYPIWYMNKLEPVKAMRI
ncbi:MAG: ABC transporter permease [Bacteroidota bacterium]